MNYVLLYVKGFLIGNSDGIVILQEFPSSYLLNKESEFYIDKIFPVSLYDCHWNKNANGESFTIAISNTNSGWQIKSDFRTQTEQFIQNSTNSKIFDSSYNFYKNKHIELSYIQNNEEKMWILGVHMPIDVYTQLEAIKLLFWENLITYVQDRNYIIIGDFNTGDYERDFFQNDKQKLNFTTYKNCYKKLLECGYTDVLKGEETTTYKTPIDHILISTNKFEMKGKVLKDITLSDHYPIVAEIPDNFSQRRKLIVNLHNF